MAQVLRKNLPFPAGYPLLPAGYPDENFYVPWVPNLHTAHKLLTPDHRSGHPGHPVGETPPPICVKLVPFVKLAFSPGNRAHFGSKMGLCSAFSHYVFNDCGPDRGFYCDFALSPILAL